MTYLGPLCHQDAMSKPNNPAQRVTDREATKRKHLKNICRGDKKIQAVPKRLWLYMYTVYIYSINILYIYIYSTLRIVYWVYCIHRYTHGSCHQLGFQPPNRLLIWESLWKHHTPPNHTNWKWCLKIHSWTSVNLDLIRSEKFFPSKFAPITSFRSQIPSSYFPRKSSWKNHKTPSGSHLITEPVCSPLHPFFSLTKKKRSTWGGIHFNTTHHKTLQPSWWPGGVLQFFPPQKKQKKNLRIKPNLTVKRKWRESMK